MIHQLWALLHNQMASNQFLAGGFVLGIIGGLLAALRQLPGRAWRGAMRLIFIEVEIEDRDQAFVWMLRWLAAQPYGKKRSRSLTAFTEKRAENNYDMDGEAPSAGYESATPRGLPDIIFAPARGQHWFIYKRHLIFLHRGQREAPRSGGIGGGGDLSKMFAPEVLQLRILSRRRDFAKQIIEEARELSNPRGERRTGIMTTDIWGQSWRRGTTRRPRPIDSVILKAGVMEDMIAKVARFLASEQWYADRGIPYRLGIELMGPPGSGKSSAIAALAAHFQMDLAVMNLASSNLDDDKLCNLLSYVPSTAIVLIEDIDCISLSRDKKEKSEENKLTFSGLLNAIDGVAAGEGRILFLTTNRHEVLDPALVRPGRVDLRYEIGAPDRQQALRMFNRFFLDASDLQGLDFVHSLGDLGKLSMADIQGILIKAPDAKSAVKRRSIVAA